MKLKTCAERDEDQKGGIITRKGEEKGKNEKKH